MFLSSVDINKFQELCFLLSGLSLQLMLLYVTRLLAGIQQQTYNSKLFITSNESVLKFDATTVIKIIILDGTIHKLLSHSWQQHK